MRRVLCFGDSNTWGSATVPRPDGRYGERERWPGVLADALGSDWNVIEEGLSARTTVHTDAVEGVWLNGSQYLYPCLRSHRPLDAVVLMLGTNDLKHRFNVSAREIAYSAGNLLGIIAKSEAGPNLSAPRMLLICPPPLLEDFGTRPDFNMLFKGGREKSLQLPPHYEEFATLNGAEFLDAGQHIRSSAFDGLHLDPEAHDALGRAVAQKLQAMFTGPAA
jgi:lysophospholipase L1-like esterase